MTRTVTTFPLSATTPPTNRLVVVVSENERVMALEKKLFSTTNGRIDECLIAYSTIDPIYETDELAYVLSEDYYEAQNSCRRYDDNPPPKPKTPITPSCDRDKKTGKRSASKNEV